MAERRDLMQQCIDNCTECHSACEDALSYCLNMGGMHTEKFHLKSMLDCAQACAAGADMMLRDSPLHPKMCGVCAEACMLCAESCGQMGDDRKMRECADTCRRCAQSCRQMEEMETSFRKAA